ncbi:class I SAM-dependent methyltransferase [Peterkaempfera bronchialis]|uniref:Class I SAM-dependent methyltransferase n=1 Tax=Peterkaempfera bronchialis TaxID=2126346 RepID=A0A345T0A1_9ACTN|nr:class I SAM-dependent methyltransferase [Peterkaempfera bronchialis]AXI79406.1 class I SAM-dependent methyltransferase [Peterkaempfera bronchialis]
MTRTTEPMTDERQYWADWQRSWDRQQEWYLPDREERFRVMLDMVEAVAGTEPRVLDLACGTGSISERLLRRLPAAVSVGVDQDPALLAIGRGHFAREPRITFAVADLKDPDWTAHLPAGPYDAVVTATALHWLPTTDLLRLYGDLAGLLRPGGVFLNADHMPEPGTPLLNAADQRHQQARQQRELAEGVLDWPSWWSAAAADPLLADQVAARTALYGDHADGDIHPAGWHADRLREAGFTEVGTVWRSVQDALVAAIR